jgi:hypothetical protein
MLTKINDDSMSLEIDGCFAIVWREERMLCASQHPPGSGRLRSVIASSLLGLDDVGELALEACVAVRLNRRRGSLIGCFRSWSCCELVPP